MRPLPELGWEWGLQSGRHWGDLYPSVGLTHELPPALASELIQASPQVIIAGIAAVGLSRYLPSTPLVCGSPSHGTAGGLSSPPWGPSMISTDQ